MESPLGPYEAIPGPPLNMLALRPFPGAYDCIARYWRMESGMLSQSSPLSMLRFAMFLILARLRLCQVIRFASSMSQYTYLFWNQI